MILFFPSLAKEKKSSYTTDHKEKDGKKIKNYHKEHFMFALFSDLIVGNSLII